MKKPAMAASGHHHGQWHQHRRAAAEPQLQPFESLVAVTISVDPGPVFKLGKISLLGDASRLDAAQYGLVTGGDAGSLTILKAGDKIVADFKNEGHPLAKLTKRDVVADHETNEVDVTLTVDSGSRWRPSAMSASPVRSRSIRISSSAMPASTRASPIHRTN